MISFLARVQNLVIFTLLAGNTACSHGSPRDRDSQEHWTPPRPESSDLSLIILHSRTDAFAMRGLVRVEARQRDGGGFQATLLGDSTDKSTMTSRRTNVPIHGRLDVRVLLVAPRPRGDTLARSRWTTIQLAPAYTYWVGVSVGDSAGRSEPPCGPHYTSYPIMPNSLLRGEFLLVDVRGMPKTALC